MINILTDDDENRFLFEDESVKKHGDGYDPNETRGKMVRLKPEREEKIKAEFDCVVVHEFGDEYHLSEEERIAKNKFYEAFKVFSKCKHKYRKLDEYVVAMREALKCLDFVAENNGVYPPDKFKKLFFRDKIFINGLTFPQFKGRERKNISWEYLTEFIMSDRPAEEINPRNDENIFSSDDLEEMEDVLFAEGELEAILEPDSDEEEYRKNLFFDVETQDPGDDNVVIFLDPKTSRKLIKKQPEFLYEIKEMRRANLKKEKLSRFVYDLTYDDISQIAEYDKLHGYYSSSDMPEFKGDMTNDDDYNRYLMELEEWEKTQIKQDYHGKLKTEEEIAEIELKQTLESHGWNIRNLYGNKEKEEKLRKIMKKDKKREKAIRKKLVEVQTRRKRRMGEDVDVTPKKKGKKKKKKGKKKSSKSPQEKEVKQYKKEASESIDDFLLGAADRLDGDFDDYKEETLDWSWDSIMEGK